MFGFCCLFGEMECQDLELVFSLAVWRLDYAAESTACGVVSRNTMKKWYGSGGEHKSLMPSKFCLCLVTWFKKLQTKRSVGRRGSETWYSPVRHVSYLHFWSCCLSCQEAPIPQMEKILWRELRKSARSVDIGLSYMSLGAITAVEHLWGAPKSSTVLSSECKCKRGRSQHHFYMYNLRKKTWPC